MSCRVLDFIILAPQCRRMSFIPALTSFSGQIEKYCHHLVEVRYHHRLNGDEGGLDWTERFHRCFIVGKTQVSLITLIMGLPLVDYTSEDNTFSIDTSYRTFTLALGNSLLIKEDPTAFCFFISHFYFKRSWMSKCCLWKITSNKL
jgi:hypothetical protein